MRRTIGTGSPQVGTITPTSGSAPRASGRATGTERDHWLAMASSVAAIVTALASAKGHESQGRSALSDRSSHGT